MTHPVRIQRRRTRGYNMQAESRAINGLAAVYVGRPSKWGNPMRAPRAEGPGALRAAVEFFRKCAAAVAPFEELRGKNLACWCPLPEPGQPDHCHAAVLLELANK